MSSKEVRLMDTNEVFAIINERLKLSDPMGASLDSCVSVTELLSILSNAPTIDPESLRPHGKWIMRGGKRYCSHCGERACVTRDMEDFWYTVGTKFCPNCGAMMEEMK